jgi:hypothetical protein
MHPKQNGKCCGKFGNSSVIRQGVDQSHVVFGCLRTFDYSDTGILEQRYQKLFSTIEHINRAAGGLDGFKQMEQNPGSAIGAKGMCDG